MTKEFEPRTDLPEPKWRLVDTKGDLETTDQVRYLVKLSEAHHARMLSENKFVDVEYVHVTSTHHLVKDAKGSFFYNETAVTASDEDGTSYDSYLFFAHRALALEEALFSIGEI
jgi:hypothetical protein